MMDVVGHGSPLQICEDGVDVGLERVVNLIEFAIEVVSFNSTPRGWREPVREFRLTSLVLALA